MLNNNRWIKIATYQQFIILLLMWDCVRMSLSELLWGSAGHPLWQPPGSDLWDGLSHIRAVCGRLQPVRLWGGTHQYWRVTAVCYWGKTLTTSGFPSKETVYKVSFSEFVDVDSQQILTRLGYTGSQPSPATKIYCKFNAGVSLCIFVYTLKIGCINKHFIKHNAWGFRAISILSVLVPL